MADHKHLLAIKRAIKVNEPETVRHLLRQDPQLLVARGHGWTPFQDAAFQAKAAIMRIMLEEGGAGLSRADIANGLHHAIQLPHLDSEIVEILLGAGKVSQPFCLLYRGDGDAFGRLLAASPDVIHEKDSAGCPLLVRAAENAEGQMVRLLLQSGADIEARGPFGKSALSGCCSIAAPMSMEGLGGGGPLFSPQQRQAGHLSSQ